MPARSVILEITDDAGATRRLNISSTRFVAGRLPELDVCLPADGVSRQHAEFAQDPSGRWWVRDLGSRNGTRIAGRRISETPLTRGEEVRLGPYVLRLLSGEAEVSPLTTIAGQVPLTADDPGAVRSLAEMPAPVVQASHLSRLVQFGRELSEVEDASARLKMLCELMTGEGFPGQWATAVRIENTSPQPAMLIPPVYRARSGGPSRHPYLSSRLLTAVKTRRAPVMASNAGSRAADVQVSMVASVERHTAIACPIGGNDARQDVLYTALQSSEATGEWLAVAGLAAEQYAQSESLWLQRKLAAEHAIIQQELEQARKVQDQLVPRKLSIPGIDCAVQFHPCRWVGGDYVDVIRAGDSRVVLVVADVCGHGMQAALLALTLHAILNVQVPSGADLAAVVGNLNNYLCRTLRSNQFATALFVELDLKTGQCKSLRAGHPPPVVVDPSGQSRELRCGEFFPLGVQESQTLSLEPDQLAPGQTLAAWTDGLFETDGPDGNQLGTERLIGELVKVTRECESSSQIAESLIRFVDDFGNKTMAADDRSLLILRRA